MKNRHREKIDFLKEKGICFGCLHQGHLDRSPVYIKVTSANAANKNLPALYVQNSTQVFWAGTGVGNVLSVLPVKIKAGRGEKVITAYAFIDPGSLATFCTEGLMSQLNVQGRKTNILLQIMSHKTYVPTYAVSGLDISGLEENNFLPLPDVFNIPVIDSSIELLIGTNASKIIEPWQVINSQGEGPYAIKSLVGWVVNGPLRHGRDKSAIDNDRQSAEVNRISVANLEKLFISR